MASPRTAALRLTLALTFLLPSVALAQDGGTPPPQAERQTGYIPAEVEAYEAAAERFRSRMNEFTQDARAIVDQLEREERDKVKFTYSALVSGLEDEELKLRDESIARFEEFLRKYPDGEYSPHVMFRLAELYFDVAGEQYIADMSDYNELVEQAFAQGLADIPEEPTKDLSPSIRLYERILANHGDYEYLDGTLYMLGYCYSDAQSRQFMEDPDAEEKSLAFYNRLVSEFPDSQFAADGNFRIGEYHFTNNDIELAVPYYAAVLERAQPEEVLYQNGTYMLAWSHYKLSDYSEALALFTQLLDISEQVFLDTGRESNLKPEAVEYTAISFSDLADKSITFADPAWRSYATEDTIKAGNTLTELGLGLRQVSSVEVHNAWYAKAGRREFEIEVVKKLAEVLVNQARYEEAIATYRYIQSTWPNDPENPEYQMAIARLYVNLPLPDEESSRLAISQLNEMYNEESSWALANRNNPDALNTARKYIEQSLYTVAAELHGYAQQTGNPEDYSKAADRYQEYLRKFPFADDYFRVSWYLADCLFFSERYDEALEEYAQLLKAGGHAHVDGAIYQTFMARFKILEKKYGGVEKAPQDAVVERTVETQSGGTRDVLMLSPDHKAFIEAADAVIATDFADPDFKKAKAENISALHYMSAQILYAHGHYEEARPRLEELIDRYPRTDNAAYAARLVVNSYTNDGDLENVLQYSSIYRMKNLGADPSLAANNEATFTSLREDSAFKIALRLKQEGNVLGAADAFMDYIDEYPKSENVPLALYNAANNYELAGKADRANELFEEYINRYPQGEFAEGLYFRIATNYASILELDKAIEYYESLYQYFDDNVDAPAALYMAGFLRTGIGDYRGAAENFEIYVRKFADQPDTEQVYWLAGEQWKKISDDDTFKFYRRYLQKFPDQNADHVLEAKHWTAKYYEREGNARKADQAWDDLNATFASLAAAGPIGPKGRNLAAEAAFREYQAIYDAFVDYDYPKNEEKLVELLTVTKPEELGEIEAGALQIIKTYQDFEYSSAATYLWGAAYLDYADKVFNAPAPPSIAANPELEMLFREQLDSLARPVEEKGVARLVQNLEKAQEAKRNSVWIDKTIVMLNDLNPTDYPLEKAESRGEAAAQVVPTGGPIDMPEPEAPAAPEGSADPATPTPPPAEGTPDGEGVWQE
ncbi:MAG: tetratricopeptide repeat protein [Alphaproteobacteria bacterium]|nr:tetratricopeptide repeat protein [Alphaproteobacteria bacterium]